MTGEFGDNRIGFIGTGQMATALAKGFLKAGSVQPDQLSGCDVSADAAQRFARDTGGRIAETNDEVVHTCRTLFLAVKPQQLLDVLREVAPHASESHLFVSIAAGVPLARLATGLGAKRKIIRVMPNTPCLVGEGASAFARNEVATEHDAALVKQLLSTVGTATEVAEKLLDAVTGLSGSGPAYAYLMIEALSDGGVRMGLPRVAATQLAAQTLLGAARLVLESGQHPGQLKDAVTSPGGTTIAGLHALEIGSVRAALMNAVQAATERAAELGRA